jgi:hypothetical protein
MKKIEDYLHHYLGCEILVGDAVCTLIGIEDGAFVMSKLTGRHIIPMRLTKPILRPLSDMTEEEIVAAAKFICAVPNEQGFEYEIQKCHNTVGAKFFNHKFTAGQYLSIYNEKNRPETIGHIEVGWYSDNKIDRRKTKELWKVGGCHELTIYLLSKGFDLFGLIEAGLAIDKTLNVLAEK